jgi:hypothetical protein
MTWAVIFSLAVVVIVVVGFVITRRQRDNAWKQLAGEVGGEFIDGGMFRSSKVQARVQQWTLTLDTYTLSSGDSSTTFSRLRSPLQNKDGFQLKLFREGLVGKLDKALGGQDIEIGVPDFDDAFVIQGNNETKLQALLSDVKIRQLIQAQRSITLSLKGEELRFEAQGVIKDVPRLKSLFELFGELLNRLEG